MTSSTSTKTKWRPSVSVGDTVRPLHVPYVSLTGYAELAVVTDVAGGPENDDIGIEIKNTISSRKENFYATEWMLVAEKSQEENYYHPPVQNGDKIFLMHFENTTKDQFLPEDHILTVIVDGQGTFVSTEGMNKEGLRAHYWNDNRLLLDGAQWQLAARASDNPIEIPTVELVPTETVKHPWTGATFRAQKPGDTSGQLYSVHSVDPNAYPVTQQVKLKTGGGIVMGTGYSIKEIEDNMTREIWHWVDGLVALPAKESYTTADLYAAVAKARTEEREAATTRMNAYKVKVATIARERKLEDGNTWCEDGYRSAMEELELPEESWKTHVTVKVAFTLELPADEDWGRNEVYEAISDNIEADYIKDFQFEKMTSAS